MLTTTTTTPLVDTSQAANAIGVHAKTLGKWAREGIVPSFRVGNGYRFDLDELRESLRTGTCGR